MQGRERAGGTVDGMRPTRLLLAVAALALVACGSSPAPEGPLRDPTVEEVRAASRAYLEATRSEIVSITVKDHHVGVYVRGTPEWSLDQFVEYLPTATKAAREMLEGWPTVLDVDICGDGPWLPHDGYEDFAPASRVQVFRDRLARMPAEIATPADVIREGGTTRSMDYYLDQRIISESRAYRDAAKASSAKATRAP